MSDPNTQRILNALREARTKLEEAERGRSEPIAIISMACRFPGRATTPELFWQLLAQGTDTVQEIPPSRWDVNQYYDPDPDRPGKMTMRYGAFLEEPLEQFDPHFFEISPREAHNIDPQHRLLLEVSWEALERAGHIPDRVTGHPTGVFVGITANDYGRLIAPPHNLDQVSAYYISGNHLNSAPGRISYTFGLQGPSLAIDTACSSSLVAVHLACQSLRQGECRQAIAGGVHLILSPESAVALSKARMLSADGRCKTFSASADGFGAGEGCAVVVLKRLSDALADRDPIIALLRGSAVNNDGPSSGFTVPNGRAQQNLIRQALNQAKVSPAHVSYIEAHGTGTSLGDPIEVQALAQALGPERTQPLWLGSVKTNLGHLTAAAGIAGLIKVALSLQHQQLPPHLHFDTPNPHIPWDNLPIQVVQKLQPWPTIDGKQLAGVSSFGASGTNAFVVLESAPAVEPLPPTHQPTHLLTLSAHTPAALEQLTAAYQHHLAQNPALHPADLCFTANTGRKHQPYRRVVVGQTLTELQHQLNQPFTPAAAPETPPAVAFLFTGQGAQTPQMGQELYQTSELFRQTINHCLTICQSLPLPADLPLTELTTFFTSSSILPPSSLLSTAFAQPALFILEYALAQIWLSWGVQPTALLGHSLGEITAACLAGVFSLEDALKLVIMRGYLMGSLPAGGGMVAVMASEATVRQALTPYPDVSVATMNSPENVVVSGPLPSLEVLCEALEAQGLKTTRLNVSHAFHSALLDPMLEPLRQVAETLTYHPAVIPVISNLTGRVAGPELSTPTYWVQQARQAVQFSAGLQTLQELNCHIFIEIGPKPTLLGFATSSFTLHPSSLTLPSLRPNTPETQQLFTSLGQAYTAGLPINWTAVTPPANKVLLPTTPFQRQRYWLDQPPLPAGRSPHLASHPLLGKALELPESDQGIRFEQQVNPASPSWLTEHQVQGVPVLPTSAVLDLLLTAGHTHFGTTQLTIQQLTIENPLVLTDPLTLHLLLKPQTPNQAQATLYAKPAGQKSWVRHLTATITTTPAVLPTLPSLPSTLTPLPTAQLYERFTSRGLQFGPSFQVVENILTAPLWASGQISLPAGHKPHTLHPIWLDACFQLIGAAFPAELTAPYMQLEVGQCSLFAQPTSQATATVTLTPAEDGETVQAHLLVLNPDHQPVLEVQGLTLKRLHNLPGREQAAADWFYTVQWPAIQPSPTLHHPTFWPNPHTVLPNPAPALATPAVLAYAQALPELEEASLGFVVEAFAQLGWVWQPGEQFTQASLAEATGVLPLHYRLLERLLHILAEAHFLQEVAPQKWRVLALPHTHPAALSATAHQTVAAEWTLLERCGLHLAQVMRGETDPIQLLFPAGDLTSAAQLYRTSLGAKLINQWAQEVIQQLLATLPAGRPLRILEIGGGTGGTTSHLLPLLPAGVTQYTFTDISPLFTSQARETFKAYPFVTYRELNIGQNPAGQGFEPHSYDLVVAANVLHATADLHQTMGYVRQLLAPQGLLLMLEGTDRQRWVDLIFGLTDGWWVFTDYDLRPSHPLLTPEQWQNFLPACGFQTTSFVSAHEPFRQALLLAQATPAVPEQWLIIAEEATSGAQLAQALQQAGQQATVCAPHHLPAGLPANLVYLTSSQTSPTDVTSTQHILGLVQHLLQHHQHPERLWLVSQGAQPAGVITNPGQAAVWGLGRTVQLEHPELHCQLVDWDPTEHHLASLVEQLIHPAGSLLAYRAGQWTEPRLTQLPRPGQQPLVIRPEGSYLVTGGLRGIGLRVAEWLAEQGARHLVLVGRTAPTAEAEAVLQKLQTAGVNLTIAQTDVSDRDACAALIHSLPQLRGVVHSAGVFADRLIAEHNWPLFEQVFAPKVAGSWHLHELTQDRPLDFFVLFSAAASLLGGAGLANYVAANSFVDVLAHLRHQQGLPALAINWGAWAQVGMAQAVGSQREAQWAAQGITPMRPGSALHALGLLMGSDLAQAGVLPVDWGKFMAQFGEKRPGFLANIQINQPTSTPNQLSFVAQLQATPAGEQWEKLQTHVQMTAAQVLGFASPEMLPAQAGFFQLGMDSLMSVELRNRLQHSLGHTLPATLTFKYPTVQELTHFLAQEVLGLKNNEVVAAQETPAENYTDEVTALDEAELADLVDEELKRLLG